MIFSLALSAFLLIRGKNSASGLSSLRMGKSRWPTKRPLSTLRSPISIFLLFVVAAALRLARLAWQPLWWDEGYSVYFATEPLARMVALTARDIHPPLYYLLLHGWIGLLDALGLHGAGPVALRSFSVLCGALALPVFWWLASALFPGRWRLHLVAVGLLLLNPLHIFYSQEVRMYGLALLLGTFSSVLFWRLLTSLQRRPNSEATTAPSLLATRSVVFNLIAYILAATALLYTLYYGALLLAAHFAYGLWLLRKRRRAWLTLLATGGAVALLYAPWLLYAAPRLATYVAQKVLADADAPLSLLPYALRHLRAFSAGHVLTGSAGWESLLDLGVIGAIALLVIGGLVNSNWLSVTRPRASEPITAYCLLLIALPLTLGFAINLVNPFFPEGGERLMLIVLPYFLLWVAAAADDALSSTGSRSTLGLPIALALLAVASLAGTTAFFAVPRYAERDYRPVVQQIVEQGTDGDRVLAIFPWQLGYWRAYTSNLGATSGDGRAPGLPNAEALAQQPLLLSDSAVDWSPAVAQTLDAALADGRVWFPAPLAFGSTLPAAIEEFLGERAVNVANDWLSETTRLSAWESPRPLHSAAPAAIVWQTSTGSIALLGAGATASVASANDALHLQLTWAADEPSSAEHFVALRLVDGAGRPWASRRYEPLGSYAVPDAAGKLSERVGLIVPPGLPPDTYEVQIGVGDVETDELLASDSQEAMNDGFVALGTVQVVAPSEPLSPVRLPLDQRLDNPATVNGATLLGYSGLGAAGADGAPVLAGTALDVVLGWAATSTNPFEINVALLNGKEVVAGWRGNPFSENEAVGEEEAGLRLTPVEIFLPSTLASGDYALAVQLAKAGDFRELGTVRVVQRAASFAETAPAITLETTVQFGTHAELVGYDVERNGDAIDLRLHWHVRQPIVPPHHLFVHAENAAGKRLAQADGVPRTVAGPAPTGSWQPDERLVTLHEISAAAGIAQLRVGLYEPTSEQRLPASAGGEVVGDAWVIPVE